MSHHNPMHGLLHGISHVAQHEKHAGHPKRANGLTLIIVGISLMPIPIIGIPVLIYGICKAVSSGQS